MTNFNMRQFFELEHFPAVSSCVDGTHIAIKNPGGDIGEVFRNRKGTFSLNVQVACGPSMAIVGIVAHHPGSMHDNVIFEGSSLRTRHENNKISGKILADNGYTCRRYLLTPALNRTTDGEYNNYNLVHKRTRNIIERLFGIWKRRFPCLKCVLGTKLQITVTIICAVAELHKITRTKQNEIVMDNPNNALNYRRAFILTRFVN